MTMRISVLTSIFFGLLVVATLSSGLLTLWHSTQSRVWDQRIELAQASYAEHLLLQSNIYQLFKQHGDALLMGDRDGGAMEAALRARIAANLAEIRRIICREIDLVGEDEIEELELLSQIETKVQALTRKLDNLGDLAARTDVAPPRTTLVDILDNEIDAKLALVITEALDEERAEVVETLARAEAFRSRIRAGVIAIIVGTVLIAGLSGWVYRRMVVLPTLRLVAKIETFRAGNKQLSPPVNGAMELRQLDRVLESMIAVLDQREVSTQEQNARLEHAVLSRTRELERLLTQIEQSEAARRQMMADVSHELRTPLTIIQGEADVSLRGAAKTVEVYAEALSRIRETAKHANHVVDDLMLIARQESGKLRLDLRDVDLCSVLRETAALLPREVTLDLSISQAIAKADPMRIRQCLLALFQNARRYGGEKIWARVEPVTNGFALIVEDNGAGMGDAEKAQAFDRFFRGSNAAYPEIEGTGLGLPIVRAIARAHGGSVNLEDREGGGLRVVMVLAADRPIGLVWNNDRYGATRH
jgi:signal transduction histidine kinase